MEVGEWADRTESTAEKMGRRVCDAEGAGKSQCESGSGSNVDVSRVKHTHTHINAGPEVCRGEPRP